MGAKPKKDVEFPTPEQAASSRTFTTRWGGKADLFLKGYLPVPSAFLEHYAALNPPINSSEAIFVLQLMDHKWDSKHPFPGYKKIAKRMGISDKMARTHAQSLETKKYLQRQMRVGRTNRFDLSPLFEALASVIEKKTKKVERRVAQA
jgi:hypothetical protein